MGHHVNIIYIMQGEYSGLASIYFVAKYLEYIMHRRKKCNYIWGDGIFLGYPRRCMFINALKAMDCKGPRRSVGSAVKTWGLTEGRGTNWIAVLIPSA